MSLQRANRQRSYRRLSIERLEARQLFAADVIINEILASNGDTVQDEDGAFSDFIELYNRGDAAANLTGWHLTDSANNLTKWSIPAVSLNPGEYLTIFASSKNRVTPGAPLHTNFNLSIDGEYLALVMPDGATIVSGFAPSFPAQLQDISFGVADLYENDVLIGQEYRYLLTPTPGTENGEGVLGFVADVQASRQHGIVNEAFELTLHTATSGAAIYYTYDGSLPAPNNPSSTLYSGPILINRTTAFRAAAYKEDFARSAVNTQSYIFIEDVIRQTISANPAENPFGLNYPTGWNGRAPSYQMNQSIVTQWDDNNPANTDHGIREALLALPSMSIVMDHEDLWSPTNGIYLNATEREDEWRRPGSVEYIDSETGRTFQSNVGVQMSGGGSRNPGQAKHSFRLIFNPDFDGPGRLNEPLFDHSDFADINTIVLKGMNQDSFSVYTQPNKYSSLASTEMRDQWMLNAFRDMGNTSSEFTYVHLYINGLYWGLYEAAERIDDASMASRLGGEPEDWDIVQPYGDIKGSDAAWNSMFALARQMVANNPQAADAIFYQLQGRNPDGTRNPELPVLLDVDNLIDYLLIHYYAGSQEWIEGNFVAARNRVDPGSGFKFFVWDQDVALDDFDVIRMGQPASNTSTSQELGMRLRHSAEYRLRFADRVQKHLFNDGALTDARAIDRWQKLAEQVEPAILGESARWGDRYAGSLVTVRTGDPPVVLPTITINHWRNSVATVNDNFPEYSSRLIPRLVTQGWFTSLAAPLFSKFGGNVTSGFDLTLSKPDGSPVGAAIYYTLDGSDPRSVGGGLSTSAILYSGAVTLEEATRIKARMLNGSTWSAIVDTSFKVTEPDPYPGDYDGNFVVDAADYTAWKSEFGTTVLPGTGADGNSDGIVDASDYTVWRDNLGQTYTPAPDFSFNHIGQTYTQNFNTFRGTLATVPAYFTIAVASGTDIHRGVFNSTTNSASSFTGIMATTADGQDHSFSWRESTGPAGLDDTRVLFTFTNNTGEAITGFNFSYDVESWVNGRRDNQFRFKYDVYADSVASQIAEGRNAFETDVEATDNPNHTPINSNGEQFVRNGKSPANRITVSGFVNLTSLLKDESNPQLGHFGALQPGDTAYFRWQISNGDLEEGNRSALGFDNLSITPIGQVPGGGGLASIGGDAASDPVDVALDATLAPANHVVAVVAEHSTVTAADSQRSTSILARSAANLNSIAEAHADLLLIARSQTPLSNLEPEFKREYTVDSAFDDFWPVDAPAGLLAELALDHLGQAIA